MANSPFIFRQLFEKESSTYTYLLADHSSRQAVIIDSVLETTERDLKLIQQLNLQLKYILETHVHADHITGASILRDKTQAQIALGKDSGVEGADILLNDGQILSVGDLKIKALLTPGHTNGCTSYFVEDRVFTGDTLLIRGTGRTDFQEGSARTQFASIQEKLYRLPPETLVFPGHNYEGIMNSSIKEEMNHNPRIPQGRSVEEYVKIMDNLNLSYPKKMDQAVPANLKCGLV